MTRHLMTFAALVLLGGAISAEEKSACFGTTIDFVDTPKEAAIEAKKLEKLVFILHVSGNFEDPRFT